MWEPWVFDPAVSGSSLFSWCKVSLFMWKCFADTALFFLRNFICPLTTLWLSYVLILSRDGDQTWVFARDRRAFYHDQKIVSIDTYERFLFSWRMVLRGLPCELDIQDQQSQQRRFVLFFFVCGRQVRRAHAFNSAENLASDQHLRQATSKA